MPDVHVEHATHHDGLVNVLCSLTQQSVWTARMVLRRAADDRGSLI